MPAKNADLHGFAPDKADVVLILIDVINALDFPESDALLASALPMADRIAYLKRLAKAAKVPVIYVNDNFGRWQSNLQEIVERLCPEDDDYFVLKPKHSGCFSTTLDVLLEYLQAETLIITGVSGNIYVLFTANDAYMRDFHLVVPSDCVALNTDEENRRALDQIAKVLKADIRLSTELTFPFGPDPNVKPGPAPPSTEFAPTG